MSQLANDSGYLTEIPAEYITEEELTSKDYATNTSLSAKLDVATYNEDKANFATKDEIPEALPIASSDTLGGIKVGAGLSINPETGVLSATGGGTADSVDWANVTSKPDFKTVATTGSYNDLTDKPTIPTKTSELTNDSGFITSIPEEYVTETELAGKNYATVSQIPSLEGYATQTWVSEQGYLTEHQDISNLATKQELTEGLATKQDKGDYATKTELSSKLDTSTYNNDKATFETKTNAEATYQPKGNYLTSVPSEYITESELEGKGYALKSEIPDTSTLATKEELTNGLANKANTSDISDMLTKTEASTTYATKLEVTSGLEGKADASDTYSKSEVDSKINSAIGGVYKYKGSKSTYSELPSSGNEVGDVWNVLKNDINYAWTGSDWDPLGGTSEKASSTIDGLMSKEDKAKLDTIEQGAQVNTVTSVAGRTGAIILSKTDVGLGNVDNTSDANKPISTATQSALDNKADKIIASNESSGAVTKQLNPNTYYKFGECTSLTITLAAETGGIFNEYSFEFTSGDTATTLAIPESIKWNNGSAPTIEANKKYLVAITGNIAFIGGA
ncbi:probable acetyl xylan esterase AxeA [Parabacteroides sp. CAG:409]|nr:probable acetyl xylan esterase AxeA [Parabacteroides sp. CAG:409]